MLLLHGVILPRRPCRPCRWQLRWRRWARLRSQLVVLAQQAVGHCTFVASHKRRHRAQSQNMYGIRGMVSTCIQLSGGLTLPTGKQHALGPTTIQYRYIDAVSSGSSPGGSLMPCCLSEGPVSGCLLTTRARACSSCRVGGSGCLRVCWLAASAMS
jgi:hypothetical protein